VPNSTSCRAAFSTSGSRSRLFEDKMRLADTAPMEMMMGYVW
jgi:hypothetical protein